MWTDPYISQQLLKLHINEAHDVASRKAKSILKTVEWLTHSLKPGAKVLDLGCGPGLYTQRLAQAGLNVTGVDFSASSIEYAKGRAKKERLDIRYILGDYLETGIGEGYDAVLLIYCDFGVLDPTQRGQLLRRIHAALRPGGCFVFDALNKNALCAMRFEKTWEMRESGFWRSAPYVCLSEKFHFPGQKATLDQHIVLCETGRSDVYRFWNHYFDKTDICRMAETHGYESVEAASLFTANGGSFNDDGVTFYTLRKGDMRCC